MREYSVVRNMHKKRQAPPINLHMTSLATLSLAAWRDSEQLRSSAESAGNAPYEVRRGGGRRVRTQGARVDSEPFSGKAYVGTQTRHSELPILAPKVATDCPWHGTTATIGPPTPYSGASGAPRAFQGKEWAPSSEVFN